ncbi:flavodoxin family protein, partial [Chloroflexota bacterium]
WTVTGKELKPCDGCGSCEKTGTCHINDDMQELFPKVLAADGIIFSSPAYFRSLTAQAKTVIDRLYSLYQIHALANKVAAVISVTSSRGHEGIWQQFGNFTTINHMLLADHAHGFAGGKGDIRKDRYAMKASEELGKQVVSLIKQQGHWAEEYRKPLYRICKDEYNIDSCPVRAPKVSM